MMNSGGDIEQCDHETVAELDPENYDLGDEVACDDCGLGFIVQTDNYRGKRYFLAEHAAELRDVARRRTEVNVVERGDRHGRWYSNQLQWTILAAGTVFPGFVAWYGAVHSANAVMLAVVVSLSALMVFSGVGVWVTGESSD